MANQKQPTPKPEIVTDEQIAKWKRDYGSVFVYEADGKRCYLRRPNRKIIAAASVSACGDTLLQKELVIRNCFLGGDTSLVAEDKYFWAFSAQIESLIEVVEGELKEV